MATREYRSRILAPRSRRPSQRADATPGHHERDGLVRVVLKVALALALIAGAAQLVYSFHRLQADWGTSVASSQRTLSRQLGVDPRVVDRIATILPARAHYRFAESPELRQTFIGPTFEAFLRARLLPRLQVTDDAGAWQISWGLSRRGARTVVNVGRPSPQTPPLYVWRNG